MAGRLFSLERGPEGELIARLKYPRFRAFPEFRGHFRSARREILLAFRSLLDEAISAIEEREEREKREKEEIKVE